LARNLKNPSRIPKSAANQPANVSAIERTSMERTMKTEGTAAPATWLGRRVEITTELLGALASGSHAYMNGLLALGRTVGGFGREIADEAGRHVDATVKARSLREGGELQAAWVQHRLETSTAHAKEFADLAHAKTRDVIAPFAALLKRDGAA
jgi:Phasin protein